MSDRKSYAPIDLDEYAQSSAVELARRVALHELSPVQLTECAFEIALREEPRINAYAALMPEQARRAAVEREREAADGRLRGPLHGVPIASKDNLYIAGEPSGKGSLTSPDTLAATSSPMVERLLAAGAVIIGRTTTPEFGWKGTGISPRTGITRNPWDESRNSGGSSAGSGATVSSGAVPLATGSDAGGSVRIPASFCGVVGLKPTLGAIPVWPGTVNENLSHAGVLTRRVEDARLVFAITRGSDARDPQSSYSIPIPAETGRRPKVGVVREPFGIAPDARVATVFDESLRILQGADVADFESATVNADLPRSVFEALWVTGRGLGFRDLIREHRSIMDPGLARLAGLAEAYSLPDFFEAMQARRAFNSAAFALFDDWDLLLMPTMPITAFAADAEVPVGGEMDAPLPWITWTPYTYPFNISGQPAITIPTHLSPGHLPVGLQIVGPWSHDLSVLDFAERCESALSSTNQTRVAPRP
ncbi:amidase family protein [soil metagenome]